MQYTIFDTPVVKNLFHYFSRLWLWAAGWKTEGNPPDAPKYVLIAAPHTSNWDFVYTLLIAFTYKIKVFWMGKASLFKGWRGPVMRWLGGIAVVREKSTNMVERQIAEFEKHDRLILIVPPEGTRGQVTYWKTGFYHIAHGAGVPIGMGFIDFGRKIGGFGPAFVPTGDIEKDLAEVKLFYSGIKGKRADMFSKDSIGVRNRDDDDAGKKAA